jgi:hypothetical protein
MSSAAGAREAAWIRCTWIAGVSALTGYFAVPVFHLPPWAVGRWIFFLTGAALSLAAFAFLRACRDRGEEVLRDVGLWAVMISGLFMHAMAVIQDGNFTTMRTRIAEAGTAAVKQTETAVMWGVNNVQLSLDICFDIWISIGAAFLAAGLVLKEGRRWLGALGLLATAFAFGMNAWKYPAPPAEVGGLDGGPFLAAWFGLYMWFELRRSARPG